MSNQTQTDANQAHNTALNGLLKELCYKVFLINEDGKQLLDLLERLNFYSPVCHPAKDMSWGWFNEGRNDMIRSLRNAALSFVNHDEMPKNMDLKVNNPVEV